MSCSTLWRLSTASLASFMKHHDTSRFSQAIKERIGVHKGSDGICAHFHLYPLMLGPWLSHQTRCFVLNLPDFLLAGALEILPRYY